MDQPRWINYCESINLIISSQVVSRLRWLLLHLPIVLNYGYLQTIRFGNLRINKFIWVTLSLLFIEFCVQIYFCFNLFIKSVAKSGIDRTCGQMLCNLPYYYQCYYYLASASRTLKNRSTFEQRRVIGWSEKIIAKITFAYRWIWLYWF